MLSPWDLETWQFHSANDELINGGNDLQSFQK